MTRVLALAAVLLALASSSAAAQENLVPFRTQTTITPGPHFFGDTIRIRIAVFVDTKLIDPATVRVDTLFDPYEVTAHSKTTVRSGRIVDVSHSYTALCVAIDCVPKEAEKRVRFGSATVRYRERKGLRHTVLVDWPTFRLIARAPKKQTSQEGIVFGFTNSGPSQFFRTPSFPPPPSHRASPVLLGVLLFLGAALALAGAGVTAVPVAGWAQERLAARGRQGAERTGIEEALHLVREKATTEPGTSEHREALARLSSELWTVGLGEFVRPVTRLAWSAESPTREESLDLAEQITARINGTR
jgi:hypothetical protein